MAKKNEGNTLFNVKIGGHSIGIATTVEEAQNWLRGSMSAMKKEIVPFYDSCAEIRTRLIGSPVVGAKISIRD